MSSSRNEAIPFLRWAGGKQRLATAMVRRLPEDLEDRLYVEPFIGAGSMFFRINPRRAIIADLNEHLVYCFRSIRDAPALVARYLAQNSRLDSEDHYYSTRSMYNRLKWWGASQTARFIYMNRTCFNGIFRVTRNGEFNVPYAFKERPTFPRFSQLLAASKALRRARLRCQCFRKTLAETPRGAFVYLDPPYPPLNGTAYFTHYTQDRFNEIDQRDLADLVVALDSRGIHFLMSNADTPLIRQLYRPFDIERLCVTRSISCKSTKHRVREVIITNY